MRVCVCEREREGGGGESERRERERERQIDHTHAILVSRHETKLVHSIQYSAQVMNHYVS